jgi:HTH-type transcriptional regulator / antitoxin HigA
MAVQTDKQARLAHKKSRPTGLSKYIARVRNFPLEPIRNEAHLVEAQAVLDKLLQEDLDAEGEMYLGALTCLVEAYEEEHEPALDVSEADVLRELMRANGLTQRALEEKVGISQSTISAVLNGTRSLTRNQVLALSKRFLVRPSAFLPLRPQS